MYLYVHISGLVTIESLLNLTMDYISKDDSKTMLYLGQELLEPHGEQRRFSLHSLSVMDPLFWMLTEGSLSSVGLKHNSKSTSRSSLSPFLFH